MAKAHEIKGDWLDESGIVSTMHPRYLMVLVQGDGTMRDPEYGFDLIAERYGDGDYITGPQVAWTFLADSQELERVGVKFELCGSARA